ncbi:MAG: hypothetical protein AAF515_19390 [Pseudomonadota bacterium]
MSAKAPDLSDAGDPIVITPRAAPLSERAGQLTGDTQPQGGVGEQTSGGMRQLAIFAGVALATAIAIYALLPRPPERAPAASEAAQSSPAQTTDEPTALPSTPFRDTQLARAKEQAQEHLARFVEVQIELEEQLNVAGWGAKRYEAIKDVASAGDEQFVKRDFEAALGSYATAADQIEALRDSGERDFAAGLQEALAAILDFDQPRAEMAIGDALIIKPDDAAALAAQARAAQIPELERLLRQARQLARRGDIDAARERYTAARALDPLVPGVDSALAELAGDALERRYQQRLSEGFAALESRRYAAARRAFNAALADKPGDSVALGALQQVSQETEVVAIRRLREEAEQAVAAERWEDAEQAYTSALEKDGALAFAQNGRREARERRRLMRGMQIIQSQSDKLSSDKRMQQARELVAEAEAKPAAGPKWRAAIAAARATIERYAQPVAVTLRSDNRTQVTVYRVGALGTFARHELQLRPGTYTIVGSRAGCRDVRKEVLVKPGMAPVDIRCEQAL